MTCGIGPYTLAFPNTDNRGLQIIDYIMNAIFAVDIVLNFFQAYLDQDFTLIDDR